MSYQERPFVCLFFNHSLCCAINFATRGDGPCIVEPGHKRSTSSKNLARKSDASGIGEAERFEGPSIFLNPRAHQFEFGFGRSTTPLPTPDAFPDFNFGFHRIRMHAKDRAPAPAEIGNDYVEAVHTIRGASPGANVGALEV
jgi:hypothetical protein